MTIKHPHYEDKTLTANQFAKVVVADFGVHDVWLWWKFYQTAYSNMYSNEVGLVNYEIEKQRARVYYYLGLDKIDNEIRL